MKRGCVKFQDNGLRREIGLKLTSLHLLHFARISFTWFGTIGDNMPCCSETHFCKKDPKTNSCGRHNRTGVTITEWRIRKWRKPSKCVWQNHTLKNFYEAHKVTKSRITCSSSFIFEQCNTKIIIFVTFWIDICINTLISAPFVIHNLVKIYVIKWIRGSTRPQTCIRILSVFGLLLFFFCS